LQKVVFKKQNFNRLGNVKIQRVEINEKVKKKSSLKCRDMSP